MSSNKEETASVTSREEEGASATGRTNVACPYGAPLMSSFMEEELNVLANRMNNLLIRPLTIRIPHFRFILPAPEIIRIGNFQSIRPRPNPSLSQSQSIPDPSQIRLERRRAKQREYARRYRERKRIEKNSAVDVSEDSVQITEETLQYYDIGNMDQVCPFCSAFLFHNELPSLCCNNGQTQLPPLQPVPQQLKSLFTANTEEARHFRRHIRAYNSVHAFTSTGVNVDRRFDGNGVSNFRIHGEMYHLIGSVLPAPGQMPKFHQIYVYDQSAQQIHRQNLMENLDTDVCDMISNVMIETNPYVRQFQTAAQIMEENPSKNLSMVIRAEPSRDPRRFNIPIADEIAVMLDSNVEATRRDIVIRKNNGLTHRISELNPAYDPLHYVLLFPKGEDGFRLGIAKNCRNPGQKRKNITISDFYSYRLMQRLNEDSILHRGGKLFQQYICDQYAKQDQSNLNFIRHNQSKIRADLYQGLADSLQNDGDLRRAGRVVVLPSSYKGGVRDMQQSYQDAMAIVRAFGKPDYFVTFTCNPNWPEIKRNLHEGQSATDHPDLVARVFQVKLKEFLKDLDRGAFLGKAVAKVHVVEFQKRGLPHAHILLIVQEASKPRSCEDYDNVICAEIPDPAINARLHNIVKTCMVHGPCGSANPNAPCMVNGVCSKGFPKEFCEATTDSANGYPKYRRRNDGRTVEVKGVQLDNRWIVPYNPNMLFKFSNHINVEYCATVKSVKYLYKYVYKGHDMATAQIRNTDSGNEVVIDEIQQHIDMRYISSSEAVWRIFQFEMSGRSHAVYRLPVHLPNEQYVYFDPAGDNAHDVLEANKRTMLTEWFRLNQQNENARQLSYADICKDFRWDQSAKVWVRRCRTEKVIGRMFFVNPMQGERYYLRLLLCYVPGATSYEYLRTVNSVLFPDFKAAAEARGLVENVNEAEECFVEAATFKSGRQLRNLFGQLLLFTHVSSPGLLWDRFQYELCDDIMYRLRQFHPSWSENQLLRVSVNKALAEVQEMLHVQGKVLPNDMRLPEDSDIDVDIPRIIAEHLDYNRDDLQELVRERLLKLTPEQRNAFHEITAACGENYAGGKVFFIDGPGGTGKTFTYNTILAHLRSQGKIALAVASCGVAALLLEGGQTAHSLFKIPISVKDNSTCNVTVNSDLAELLRRASLIIWDEAPMQHRHAFEAVDRSLRDIIDIDEVFGGKTVLMGGDFRQILPVVPRGSRADIVNAAINKSPIWGSVKRFRLTKNMRVLSLTDNSPKEARKKETFADALLAIGNGNFSEDAENNITLPEAICLTDTNMSRLLEGLIERVFPNLPINYTDKEWMSSRSILTSVNQDVHELNDLALSKLPGQAVELLSIDTVDTVNDQVQFPTEFLNTVNVSGMPLHKLKLKVGAPIILMRNLNIREGLSNGTRLIITRINQRVLEAEHVTGARVGQQVFIPRIKLRPSDSSSIDFYRMQFPVQLAFSMSINKAQGQSLKKVGIYLPKPVFSHGQLYVALSRASNWEDITLLIKDPETGNLTNKTKNVVFKNALNY